MALDSRDCRTNDNDCSDEYLLPLNRDAQHDQAVRYHRQQQGAQKAALQGSDAARHTGAAQDNRRDNLHLSSLILCRKITDGHNRVAQAGDSRQTAVDHEDAEADSLYIKAGPLCGHLVAAHRGRTCRIDFFRQNRLISTELSVPEKPEDDEFAGFTLKPIQSIGASPDSSRS